MRKAALAGVVVVAFLVVMPGRATGQLLAQDSATGTGSTVSGSFGFEFNFSARSDPSGENPTGEASVRCCGFFPSIEVRGPVTCMAVSGPRAVLGIRNDSGGFPAFAELFAVDGAAGAGGRFTASPALPIPDCAPLPDLDGGEALVSGEVTITDAPTKDQCKNGGWRNFLGFKNQGDCVSFVATGGKN